MNIPASSPWGKVQESSEFIAEGVIRIYTSGHGGLKLDRERNALIPAYMRRQGGWYEEDCEASIPMVILGIAAKLNVHNEAVKTFKDYYPAQYELHFNTVLKPGESLRKDELLFEQENEKNLVVIAVNGCDEWENNRPAGFVAASATVGGVRGTMSRKVPERHFYIPLDEYKARGRFGFVIREPIIYLEVLDEATVSA